MGTRQSQASISPRCGQWAALIAYSSPTALALMPRYGLQVSVAIMSERHRDISELKYLQADCRWAYLNYLGQLEPPGACSSNAAAEKIMQVHV